MPSNAPEDQAEKELMTAEEAAAYLRISLNTLYSWTSTSRIPFRKVGTLLRFSRRELDAWTQPASTEAAEGVA